MANEYHKPGEPIGLPLGAKLPRDPDDRTALELWDALVAKLGFLIGPRSASSVAVAGYRDALAALEANACEDGDQELPCCVARRVLDRQRALLLEAQDA